MGGDGKVKTSSNTSMGDNYTNMLIVRCGKEFVKLLWTAIAMINNIDGVKTRMHVIGVSGTIKRCEMRAKKFLEKWICNYEQLKRNNEMKISNIDGNIDK